MVYVISNAPVRNKWMAQRFIRFLPAPVAQGCFARPAREWPSLVERVTAPMLPTPPEGAAHANAGLADLPGLAGTKAMLCAAGGLALEATC